MSVYATTWVWKHSEAEGNDRLVLLAIADSAEHDGTNSWPRISKLAQMARIDRRTVQRCVARLVEMGELVVEEKAGGSRDTPDQWRPNRYALPLVDDGDKWGGTDATSQSTEAAQVPLLAAANEGGRGGTKQGLEAAPAPPFRSTSIRPEREPQQSVSVDDDEPPPLVPPEHVRELRESIKRHPANPPGRNEPA